MTLIDNSAKTNWKFIGIVVIVAVVIGGGILMLRSSHSTPDYVPPLANLPTLPRALQTYSTQEECEAKASCTCAFVQCDYIPPGKTFEEVCGKDFKKGWQCIIQREEKTVDWQTYRNEEFGFEVKYPENWKIEEGSGYILSSQAGYEYISIDSVPIKTGQEILDVVMANTGMGECSPPNCRQPAEDEIFARNFEGNPFYYVFTNLFEGDLAVAYYVKNLDSSIAIRFRFFGRSGSENWPLRGDHSNEEEPNHDILKQILSTFRFIEKVSLCEKLEIGEERNSCRWETRSTAQTKGDCEAIGAGMIQQSCFYRVAVLLNDLELCPFVYREVCQTRFEQIEEGIQLTEDVIKVRASETITALKESNFEHLATIVHPEKGIRFSLDTYVSEDDVAFLNEEMNNFLEINKEYIWGYGDGTGFPIQSTPSEFYNKSLYSKDYAGAPEVNYNPVPIQRGNTNNNIFSFYEDPIEVEYYFPGISNINAWVSLKLVFEEYNGTWYLVGIVRDSWTI